jgi:isocitrate lyase (EC 4.1.3.1)
VQAGLKAIYMSGWQVAGDANDALTMYPDQSLYPVTSVPTVIRRITNALMRADQIQHMEGRSDVYYFAPIVADAEAGFGGPLNTFELIKSMIEAGAGGIHLEDQLSSLKKCGHMGGKVLVPIHDFIQKLIAARLAADVLGVPTVFIGRTDSLGASLIRGDIDKVDQEFLTGERTSDGFYIVKGSLEYAVARACAYAPYVDVVWCETSTPDIGEARAFAQGVHEKFPGKLLAYNCSPSFNWKKKLSDSEIAAFQEELGAMGYKFQFITLAGFHTLNASMFKLAYNYAKTGMSAFVDLQEEEFQMEREWGFKAIKHQRFVGAGYFDQIQQTVAGGEVATAALKGSTEDGAVRQALTGAGPAGRRGSGRRSPFSFSADRVRGRRPPPGTLSPAARGPLPPGVAPRLRPEGVERARRHQGGPRRRARPVHLLEEGVDARPVAREEAEDGEARVGLRVPRVGRDLGAERRLGLREAVQAGEGVSPLKLEVPDPRQAQLLRPRGGLSTSASASAGRPARAFTSARARSAPGSPRPSSDAARASRSAPATSPFARRTRARRTRPPTGSERTASRASRSASSKRFLRSSTRPSETVMSGSGTGERESVSR